MMKKLLLFLTLFLALQYGYSQSTYCSAGVSMVDEYISSVEFGSIQNYTMYNSSGYSDYTSMSTDLIIGQGTDITVGNGLPYNGDQCGIWIDWNHDYDFDDPDEQITVTGTPGYGPYTATVTPPSNAVLGQTTMRVRITYTGPFGPCGNTFYGEIEDYSVNILPDCMANAQFTFLDYGLSVDFAAPANYDTTQFYVEWSLGDGTTIINQSSFTHVYAAPGVYGVSLEVNDLTDSTCFDYFTQEITLDTCLANATFFAEVNELDVNAFTYFAYDAQDFDLTWDMGDGTILTGSDSIDYTYSTAGIYVITLNLVNVNDTTCSDQFTQSVDTWECDINTSLDVDLSGNYVDFQLLPPVDLSQYSVVWDFGNGNSSFQSNYAYAYYSSTGYYDVSVTIQDYLHPDCNETIESSVYINNCYANADFIWDSFGLQAAFSDDVFVSAGYDFIWDFGDGTVDTASNFIIHDYINEGNYDVTLIMLSQTDSLCADTQTVSITIDSCAAYADFGFNVVELSAGFYPYYPIDTTHYTTTWYFGDGNTSTDFSPSYNYAATGDYLVSFVVENMYDSTCTDSISMMVHAWSCDVDATITVTDNGNSNYTFSLDNMTTASGYDIYWEFGDGSSDYGSLSTSHTYTSAGAFMVFVSIYSQTDPCNDFGTALVCELDAGFSYTVNGMVVNFVTNEEYNLSTGGVNVVWDMGDGNMIYNTTSPVYTYVNDGTYTATLTLSSFFDPSCTDTYTVTFDVSDCTVEADYTYTIDSLSVEFVSNYPATNYIVEWNFGDGNTAAGQSTITHTYAAYGTYNVCLKLIDITDVTCWSEICYDINLNPQGILTVEQSSNAVLYPNPVNDVLNIEFSDVNTYHSYAIFNTLGQLVVSGSFDAGKQIQIPVSKLEKGAYILRLIDDNKVNKDFHFIK